MLSITRVLVPIDFTDTSKNRALDFALELAENRAVVGHAAFEIPVIGFPDGALVATADIAAHPGARPRGSTRL